MKYRKKPVVIEAFQNGYDVEPEWFTSRIGKDVTVHQLEHHTEYTIRTLEGDHRALFADYIIKGVKDELYPCNPDIFEMTYEKVEERE